MSVLESVLAYKQYENQQRAANMQGISNLLDTFTKLKQTNLLLEFEKKKLDVDLAQKGLRFDTGGKIIRDESLTSPLESFINMGKMAEVSKNIYEAGGPRLNLFGGTTKPILDEQGNLPSNSNLVPKEYDKFGRPTGYTKKEEFSADLTNKVISNIKTTDDFDEILKNKSDYEKAGVDVSKVIKQHLSNPLVKQNPSLWQRLIDFLLVGK
jgi:hypothetical protein